MHKDDDFEWALKRTPEQHLRIDHNCTAWVENDDIDDYHHQHHHKDETKTVTPNQDSGVV